MYGAAGGTGGGRRVWVGWGSSVCLDSGFLCCSPSIPLSSSHLGQAHCRVDVDARVFACSRVQGEGEGTCPRRIMGFCRRLMQAPPHASMLLRVGPFECFGILRQWATGSRQAAGRTIGPRTGEPRNRDLAVRV